MNVTFASFKPLETELHPSLQEAFLNETGIGTNRHYPIPIHLQECYQDLNCKKGDFPIAEEISSTELSIPMYYGMTGDEIQYVIGKVNEFVN